MQSPPSTIRPWCRSSVGPGRVCPGHPLEPLVFFCAGALLTPPITVMAIQFSIEVIGHCPLFPAQGSGAGATRHLLTVKLHNQRSLNTQEQQQAINDALTMGREVCALYPGFALTLQERGLALLISKAAPAVRTHCTLHFCCSAVAYETQGNFAVCSQLY